MQNRFKYFRRIRPRKYNIQQLRVYSNSTLSYTNHPPESTGGDEIRHTQESDPTHLKEERQVMLTGDLLGGNGH